MSEQKAGNPMLASLVRAGDAQTEAVKITDFIFMVNDISNAYLINTADGDVMVNTGFMDDANQQRNKALFAPVRSGPLRYIVLQEAGDSRRGAGQSLLTLCVSMGQLVGAAVIGGVVGSATETLLGYRHSLMAVAFLCGGALVLSAALRGRVVAGRAPLGRI